MTVVRHERTGGGSAELAREKGLERAAESLMDSPVQLEALAMYLRQGDEDGPRIEVNDGPYVYWHDRGVFVGPDGSIVHLRTDDNGQPQVYMSLADARTSGAHYSMPYTYDRHNSGAEMRIDFVNGTGRAAPQNTAEEAAWQRRQGLDPTAPLHLEEQSVDRDSVTVRTLPDGRVEAVLYDSVTGNRQTLYSSDEIIEAIQRHELGTNQSEAVRAYLGALGVTVFDHEVAA